MCPNFFWQMTTPDALECIRPSKKSHEWAESGVFGYRHIEVLSQEVPYRGGGVAGKVTSLPWEGKKRQSRGQVSEWTIRSASFLFWQVFPYQPNNQNAPETILRASDALVGKMTKGSPSLPASTVLRYPLTL